MTTKCPTCGLVNFAGIDVCRRCATSLNAPVPNFGYGYDPAASSASSSYPSAPPVFDGSSSWQPGEMFHAPVYGAPAQTHYGYADYSGVIAAPELATRGARLAASIVDSFALIAAFMVAFLIGLVGGGTEGAIALAVVLGLLLVAGILIAQVVMLSSRGQTIGKRIAGIRIVKLDTGENGGFLSNIVLRGLVPTFIGAVPYLGPIFTIVNILFIFREDYRCIHDLIAGTVVIKA